MHDESRRVAVSLLPQLISLSPCTLVPVSVVLVSSSIIVFLKGPAVQHSHGGRTRAEGIRRQALSGVVLQRRGAVLCFCSQRAGAQQVGRRRLVQLSTGRLLSVRTDCLMQQGMDCRRFIFPPSSIVDPLIRITLLTTPTSGTVRRIVQFCA